MAVEQDELFAKIAIHNRFVSQEQVDKARKLQRVKYPDKSLGRLLLAKRYLDEKQYQKIKAAVKKLGDKTPSTRGLEAAPGDADELDDVAEASEEEVVAAEPEVVMERKAEERRPEAPPVEPGKLLDVRLPNRDPMLHELLAFAKFRGASDLHLSVGSRPFLRMHGAIQPLNLAPLAPDDTLKILRAGVPEHHYKALVDGWDVDTCLELASGRFRTNLLKQRRGYSAVFRIINDKVKSLQELGIPEDVEKLTTFHQGLVLVTGPAGSGKSSTLAALIEVINQNRQDHIITLEDPIEYVYECKQCNVTQREIEKHTQSWGNALRAALREDPDVIMVGEMRDLDTISLAITAAETGHLVLGTLHTNNATRTVDRILDAFPPKEQAQIRAMVSESLKGIVCQQLVPKADGKGRCLALEIMYWTPAVGNLIRDGETFKLFSIMQTGRAQGMRLMDDSLEELLGKGMITKEEARFRATNPQRFA